MAEEVIQGMAFVDDLLLKQRVHHHRANTSILQLFDCIHLLGKGRSRCNQGIFQF